MLLNKRCTIAFLLFYCCIASSALYAQVSPAEGRILNYRIIGFSCPEKAKAAKYKIDLARGNHSDMASFTANILTSFTSATHKMIGEVPDFGAEYTWRVTTMMGAGGTITDTVLHHFSTGFVPEIDTALNRIKIIKPAEKYKDAYFFADCNRALYDMKGRPVWYMPITDNVKTSPRDLKLSPAGTITLMQEDEAALEISYNGDVLWRSPRSGQVSGDTEEHCHHDFTRLQNGHYMMLGREMAKLQLPGNLDTASIFAIGGNVIRDADGYYKHLLEFGTVIEYDHDGKVVWSWKSADYFRHSDLYARKTSTGLYDLENVHENAFYFDEANKMLYVSFRTISRIVKIKYPTGAVVAEYGAKYTSADDDVSQGQLFCYQHCCRRSSKGLLYLFNNNDCNFPAFPKLLMVQEPVTTDDTLKKVWEFDCDIMPVPATATKGKHFKAGGSSVYELPDHSMLACMNFNYTALFIVSPEKRVLWSAISEKWDPAKKAWATAYQYRCSMVGRKQLEQLVWAAEPGKE